MRSILVSLIAVFLGLAVSCSAGTSSIMDEESSTKVSSTGGFDAPDYIFWDGEGDDLE